MSIQWAPKQYAKAVDHHRKHDADFLFDVHPATDWKILDVGCGVADFTEKLCDLVLDGLVVGVDSSTEMIDLASKRVQSNLQFQVAAAEKLGDVDLPGPFDLIVSRACLHWVPISDHPAVLAGMAKHLRPGGRIRLEFGGAGNIPRSLSQMLAVAGNEPFASHFPNPLNPWCFMTPGKYLELLMDSSFDEDSSRVWSVGQLRSMGVDDEGLRNWFTSQVAISVTHHLPLHLRAQYEDAVMQRILPLCRRVDGSTAEIYVRLNVDACLKDRQEEVAPKM